MATHSSILACKIPQTEEPGRLLSMGFQSARHDWAHVSLSVARTVYFPSVCVCVCVCVNEHDIDV